MKKLTFIFIALISATVLIAQEQTINGYQTINPGAYDDYQQGLRIKESNAKWSLVMLGAVGSLGTSENAWIIARSKTLNFVISRNSATGLNGMVITKSGNVGFGTENPMSKLDVNGDIKGNKLDINGTIRAKEVKIEATGWSDFVFGEDYKLPSLSEVESHIKEYKHLPDVPSEKQVLEEGVNVVEMQAKLLQKIEELTLYVIDLKKENKKLENRINELENKSAD